MSTEELIVFWGCIVNSSVWLSSGIGVFSVGIGAAWFCVAVVIAVASNRSRIS